MEAYQQFRALYDQARFDEALPLAKRVVELSEASGERDHELPIAYNNLGATQYQLGRLSRRPRAATASRSSSSRATQGISSRRLVVPLAGLGAVYAAQDKHEVAAELFDRALAVSRRADGLFNLQQLPLLQQAADSRYAISDFGGAEREHLYALKIAEQNFGYGDARTLPPLLELGAFYESLREFIAARNMYMRARDVALKPGVYDPQAVKALVGIARTHRLQYTMDPDTLDSQQPARDEVTGEMIGKVYQRVARAAARRGPHRPQGGADRARPAALDLEPAAGPHDGDADRARRLVPGDVAPDDLDPLLRRGRRRFSTRRWRRTRSRATRSRRRAWCSTARRCRRAAGSTRSPGSTSSARPSSASSSRRPACRSTSRWSPPTWTRASSRSRGARCSSAIYSPRFAEGQAVSTAGVTFTSEWYQELRPGRRRRRTRRRSRRRADGNRRAGTGSRNSAPAPAHRSRRRPRFRRRPSRRLTAAAPRRGGGRRGGDCFLRLVLRRGALAPGAAGCCDGACSTSGGAGGDAGSGLPAPRSSSRTDVLVGQLDGDLGAGVAHRALGRDRERFLARERARLLAAVAGEGEGVDARAAAVIERQQVADRDDEGLARDVLRRQERVFLELRLEHERERRRDARRRASGRRPCTISRNIAFSSQSRLVTCAGPRLTS